MTEQTSRLNIHCGFKQPLKYHGRFSKEKGVKTPNSFHSCWSFNGRVVFLKMWIYFKGTRVIRPSFILKDNIPYNFILRGLVLASIYNLPFIMKIFSKLYLVAIGLHLGILQVNGMNLKNMPELTDSRQHPDFEAASESTSLPCSKTSSSVESSLLTLDSPNQEKGIYLFIFILKNFLLFLFFYYFYFHFFFTKKNLNLWSKVKILHLSPFYFFQIVSNRFHH
ncbi:hypothetical protein BY996DRAFT_1877314 [Phakopsora pachyrhizi]|nr:hypothetical protein BY996DRAFT_1877314 [Phakopsora pachyrhizi]